MENKTNTKTIHTEKPLWSADIGNGYYQNPIIYADYSDPDVIRVGEDYFMVSSSFNMTPCLPILHSKDLVNWKIINHVCETFPFATYNIPRHGDGVWAPSIRYHNGKYWVFFGAPDEGIFMSTTEDPFGIWSPLHRVKKVKGWIDPCPFWDEDGQAYLMHAFAKSRIGFKSILQICKMKSDGTELFDEGTFVFDGNKNHPTIEGPKMYKRNGYYYIFAPAGGVETGWQTILRSKNIYGPYEDKVVLHQGKTKTNGPHQGAWVELESNEDWFIHFQDKDAYGRITHLQPMSWNNDWPVMGNNINELGIGEPVNQWKKPNVGYHESKIIVPQTSDEFKDNLLGLQWQWRANINKNWYSLENGQLKLNAVNQPKETETLYDTGNILTQKFPAPKFSATTKLTFYPQNEDEYVGLAILGYKYSGIMLNKSDSGFDIIVVNGEKKDKIAFEEEEILAHVKGSSIYFRVNVDERANYQFSYSIDGKVYKQIGQTYVASKGHWTGAQLGIFCLSKGSYENSGYAKFDWFNVH